MAAPTPVAEYEGTWSVASGAKTTSVTVGVGDLLVVLGLTESNTYTLATPTGGGLTYTLAQSIVVVDYCTCYVWTAPSSSSQTFTISITESGGSGYWGFNALRFAGSDGVGASSKTNVSSGAPSLALTTTQANSAIVVANGDWNANDGASRTWRTINSVTPATNFAGGEATYVRDASRAAFYGAYWSDVGAIGAKTTGLSAPSGQKYSIIAVEVLGTAGGGTDATATPAVVATTTTLPAGNRNVGAGPTVLAATTTLPASARNVGAGPATVAGVTTLPATNRDVGAGPAVLAATTALPATGENVGAGPAVLTATVTLPQPAASVGAGPAVVPVTVTLPQATAQAGGNATAAPDTIAVTVSLPQAGAAVGTAPAVIATTVTVPATTRDVGAGPNTVATTVTLPAGALDVGAGPVTVPVVVTLPTPSAGSNTIVSPAVVTAVVSLPAAAVSVGAGPGVIPVTVTMPLVAILGTQANATSDPTVTARAASVAAVTALRTASATVTDV